MKKLSYILLALILSLAGCGKDALDPNETVPGEPGGENPDGNLVPDMADVLDWNDFPYLVNIEYRGGSVTLSGDTGAAEIAVEGARVSASPRSEGVGFVVSSRTEDGQLLIGGDEAVLLVLANADIANGSGPAVEVTSPRRSFVVVRDDSVNTLSGADAGNEDIKGALHSQGQMVLSGRGNLHILAPLTNGISSSRYVRLLEECNLDIITSVAGIFAFDYILVDAGRVVVAGPDAETPCGEGLSCYKGCVEVNGGSVEVGRAVCGVVTSGMASDLPYNPYIKIGGGTVSVSLTAAEGDGAGIKSAENVIVTGGELIIHGSSASAYGILSSGNILLGGGATDIAFETERSGENRVCCAAVRSEGMLDVRNSNLTIGKSPDHKYGIYSYGTITVEDSHIIISDGSLPGRSSVQDNFALVGLSNVIVNGSTMHIRNGNGYGMVANKALVLNGAALDAAASGPALGIGVSMSLRSGGVYCTSYGASAIDNKGIVQVSGGRLVARSFAAGVAAVASGGDDFKVESGTVVLSGGLPVTPYTGQDYQFSMHYIYDDQADGVQLITTGEEPFEPLLLFSARAPVGPIPRHGEEPGGRYVLVSMPDFVPGGSFMLWPGVETLQGGAEDHGLYVEPAGDTGEITGIPFTTDTPLVEIDGR